MCAGREGSDTSGSERGAAPEVEAGEVRLAAGEHQADLGSKLKMKTASICEGGALVEYLVSLYVRAGG